MNDILNDIEVLEKAITNLEKMDIYSATFLLHKLIIEKKDTVTEFEYAMEKMAIEERIAA